jgi:asparagine synthase (glutamine-hydrolysing)
MEKQILREAFESEDLLPPEVLWRRKEAFSDGVSSPSESWHQRCMHYFPSGFTPSASGRYTHNAPYTQESDIYRQLFEHFYGSPAATILKHMWLPRWSATTDPSARTLSDLY